MKRDDDVPNHDFGAPDAFSIKRASNRLEPCRRTWRVRAKKRFKNVGRLGWIVARRQNQSHSDSRLRGNGSPTRRVAPLARQLDTMKDEHMRADDSSAPDAVHLSVRASRLIARYRDPQIAREAEGTPWNAVLDTLVSHRSVRQYSDRALPPDALETIIAAAQSAPTSSNLQAWSVVAVRDPERKKRLSNLAAGQRHVAEAPLLLVFLADLSRLRMVAAGRGQASEGLDYLETFIVALADAAFAAQNALVASESLGLGVCYIGAMRNHPREVAEELALPDNVFAVFGMTIGYPDPTVETDVKPRLPQSIVLHHEEYEQASPTSFAAYDERLRGFRSGQNMNDIGWTEQAAGRVRDKDSLMGRHVLREILQSRGFGLR